MKTKGRKRMQSDTLHNKKTKTITKAPNPFELHQQKDKFDILNRKKRSSIGKPSQSRALAVEKRKQTLGQEFKLRNKANTFKDLRKSFNGAVRVPRESIYNLNDSEILTHSGQTLSEIERFDDIVRDYDDELSDNELRLDAKFTEAAHFGNFSKQNDKSSRATVIEELIAESKKRKVEKARDQDEILELTEKLDSNWRDLFPVVNKLQKTGGEAQTPDDYDRLVKEMVFAPRGEPAEKLKNEEDIARIEKERLEALERERQARMNGDVESAPEQPNHRSADDLDDGYFMESIDDNEVEGEKVLSYAIHGDAEQEEISEDENEVEEEIQEEETSSESESESEDDLNDLKAEEESEDEPEFDPKVLKISKSDEKLQPETKQKEVETPAKKLFNEKLEKIPFTIAMPGSYEKLFELLNGESAKIQQVILERVIKTNHPSLLHVNKSKMLKLFAYLLQYINDLFSNIEDEEQIRKEFKLLQALNPILYDLLQMNPEEASKCFLEVVKEKYENFKKNQKKFPQLDTLIFFKILGSLFPTSDFRHSIVTPAYVFIHHILSQARIKSRSDVSSGLFLATLILDYQQLSRKFLPAVLNFLRNICYLSIKKSLIEVMKPVPPVRKNDPLLEINQHQEVDTMKLKPGDFLDEPIDDEFKVRSLFVAVHLISDFVTLYDELDGMVYFLDPFETVFSRLVDVAFLPDVLKEAIKNNLEKFDGIRKTKKFIYPQQERKIQPMIRMLEPKFETVLADRRSMYCQAQGSKAEEQKLKHMVKREFKSAKRELRRDNEFLSKVKHKHRQDLDRERQAKVKRIFNEASVQQSEYNAMKAKKQKRNF